MKSKPSDVKYCNVSEDKIKSAHPVFKEEALRVFHHYAMERYLIHLRKDIEKLPEPWTDDTILGRYRFTNDRREHDYCSRYLIDNISTNSDMTILNKIYLSLLFRMYNVVEVGEALDLKHTSIKDLSDPDWVSDSIKKLDNASCERYFTNAYKTIGFTKALCSRYNLDYSTSRQYGPLYLIQDLIKNNLASELLQAKSQLEVFEILKSRILGAGSFMAYQFYVDLTYIPEFPYSENEFVISGPGCSYGLGMLVSDPNGLSNDELLFWMRDNLASIFDQYGLYWDLNMLMTDLPEYDRCLNVMMLENLMCEFSKYYVRRTNPRKHMRIYKERKELT